MNRASEAEAYEYFWRTNSPMQESSPTTGSVKRKFAPPFGPFDPRDAATMHGIGLANGQSIFETHILGAGCPDCAIARCY